MGPSHSITAQLASQKCNLAPGSVAAPAPWACAYRSSVKVLLVTNPLTDGAFRARAQRMLGKEPVSPGGLQSKLRVDYPLASVVRGIEDNGSERWYAYRDGHWVRSAER